MAEGHRCVMVQGPTGFGKTTAFVKICEQALAKRKRVMVVVPAISLVDQTAKAFYEEGITGIGVIQANHPMTDPSQPVQIACVHTLIRRDQRYIPHCDLIIVDEAHNQFEKLNDLMEQWSLIPFIGMSATPWSRGLGKRYSRLVVAATTQNLIDEGYLAPFRVYAPSHPDLSEVRVTAGDFNEGDLSKVMRGGSLVSDVVDNWLKHGERRPTLCYGVDRLHAKALQEQFLARGVSAGYIDAFTEREERAAQMQMLAEGALNVICNVGVLTTGIDIPQVSCLILARPTKSEILYTQIVGRGLRIHESKEYCLIFDHSDTTLRLGFVTDIHHEELSTDERLESNENKPEEKPSECGQCGFVKPKRTPICPACEYQAPERENKTVAQAGELVEIQAAGSAGQRKLNRDWDGERKAEFMGSLKTHAKEKGYKPGWAANQYREKLGVWPNKYKDAPACPKNEDFKKWMAHLHIKNKYRRAS